DGKPPTRRGSGAQPARSETEARPSATTWTSHEPHLLSRSIGFAEVVRREPFHCPRAVGRLFQEGLGGTKCDLAGIGRRGALRRLDRRHSQEHGRKALCDSLYTPKAEQHLELHQHSPSPEAHARKANAAGGSQGLRGPRRQQGWCLLIRAASASARRAL